MRVGEKSFAWRFDRGEILIAGAASLLLLSLGLWTGKAGAVNADGINSLLRQDQILELAPQKFRHRLPVRIEQARGLFLVDTAAGELVLSREFVAGNNLWDYHFIREVGGGDLVEFKAVKVGAWTLNDVQAVICDECDMIAGQSVLNQFHLENVERDGVEYLTLQR